jgi:hypothetical protein
MITTIQLRPFLPVSTDKWYLFYKKINWLWWLQRIPMLALAIPASYGVAVFSTIGNTLPVVIAAVAGIAFESTYIGTIALGDQMLDDDPIGRRIWLGLNIFAVLASALFNTLAFSGGKYSNISPESITHGALLPITNFFYGFLLHWISTKANKQQQLKEDQERRLQQAKAESEKEHCEYCNIGKPTKQAVWSHYRSCDNKLAGLPKKYTMDGRLLT